MHKSLSRLLTESTELLANQFKGLNR